MLAAAPIVSSGTVVGAIYGGYRFDDAYARSIRNKYLTGTGAQVCSIPWAMAVSATASTIPRIRPRSLATSIKGPIGSSMATPTKHYRLMERLFCKERRSSRSQCPYAIEGGMLIFFPTSNFAWYEDRHRALALACSRSSSPGISSFPMKGR